MTIKKYNRRNLKKIIENRFNILILFIFLGFSFLVIGLINNQVINNDKYKVKLVNSTVKLIESNSVPRGRIYDRNYNLLVDNIGKKVIYYKQPKGTNQSKKVSLAYSMSNIIDLPYNKLSKVNLKEFWLIINKDKGNNKITILEYEDYKKRKLTLSDLQKLKIERVTDEELSLFTDLDKKAAYIFYLMNKGYSYEEKIIKSENVTDEEYAYISENSSILKGFMTKLEWERVYLYDDVLRGVLGTVSDINQGIPGDKKADYLKKGYALNDRVGLSNLEYQYEDILKGTKSIYKVYKDNSKELVKEGNRGKDIVLTIDINLQLEIEKIIEEEMIRAKGEPNTEYYNKSYVIISEPKTGSILAYVGKQIVYKDGKYVFYDYSPFLATTTITSGSIVKGASMAVGYKTGVISIGTKMLDECIKLKNTPLKCSWRSGLGTLDDIDALRVSSNSYQFKIAMQVGGAKYFYNMPLVINDKAYDIYRNTFNEFGLGVKTGIDLPLEGTGLKGSSDVPGHLLDYAIGQYDTYTPLQLSQYINTIANNFERINLHFLKEIRGVSSTNEIGSLESEYKPTTLNKVNIDNIYIDRIRYGFREVIRTGIGSGYMGNVLNPAGKTGTAQSFLDTNNDGKVDKETISNTFVGYYPSDNPKMSIITISPDVTYEGARNSYRTLINKRISSRISQKFFDIYQ